VVAMGAHQWPGCPPRARTLPVPAQLCVRSIVTKMAAYYVLTHRIKHSYSHDVASAVVALLADTRPADPWRVFNVASGPPVTLHAWLHTVAGVLGLPTSLVADAAGRTFFPSVSRGPIDAARLHRALPAWRPAPVPASLHATVAFYVDALLADVPEASAALRDAWRTLGAAAAAGGASPQSLRPALLACKRHLDATTVI
jgi:nucleoside-diphosphate-sugar epimerase